MWSRSVADAFPLCEKQLIERCPTIRARRKERAAAEQQKPRQPLPPPGPPMGMGGPPMQAYGPPQGAYPPPNMQGGYGMPVGGYGPGGLRR